MIKILGICGSRVKNGNTEALLQAALSHADLNKDGVVDFKDFAIMANQWLRGAAP